jgi:hypothetical protein
MNEAQKAAETSFLRSLEGQASADVAASALLQWRSWFSATVQQDIKDGKDPRDRLDRSSKNYALAPEFLRSFRTTPNRLAGDASQKLAAGKIAAEAEMLKSGNGNLPRLSTKAELDALPAGTYFVNTATGRLAYKP